MKYLTKDGDVLDAVCYKHYGRESATVEVLAANPGLADAGMVLTAGIIIELPDLPDAVEKATITLWD